MAFVVNPSQHLPSKHHLQLQSKGVTAVSSHFAWIHWRVSSEKIPKTTFSCCRPSAPGAAWREPCLLRQQITPGLLAPATTTSITEVPSVPRLHLASSFTLECFVTLLLPPGHCSAMSNVAPAGHGAPTSPTALRGEPARSSTPNRGATGYFMALLHPRAVAFYLRLWQLLDLGAEVCEFSPQHWWLTRRRHVVNPAELCNAELFVNCRAAQPAQGLEEPPGAGHALPRCLCCSNTSWCFPFSNHEIPSTPTCTFSFASKLASQANSLSCLFLTCTIAPKVLPATDKQQIEGWHRN